MNLQLYIREAKFCWKVLLRLENDRVNKIEDDHQDHYAIHDEINSHIGFVLLVKFF